MFKKLFCGAVAKILIIGLAITQVPSGAFAFGNKSHERLSDLAFHRVLEDLEFSRHLRAAPIILKYGTGPDKDENYGPGGRYNEGHFFNAIADLNGDGEILNADTALTRMVQHYDFSVRYARCGDWYRAVEELARALHYLQGMCCPVHVWGYSVNCTVAHLALHGTLEYDWDAMWDSANALRFIPLDEQFQNTFENARELGISFNRKTLEKHSAWLHDHINDGELAGALSVVRERGCGAVLRPVVEVPKPPQGDRSWISNLWRKSVEWYKCGRDNLWRYWYKPEDRAVVNNWGDIFYIPYQASYTLVRMWAETVRDFTPPNPGCPVQ